MTTQSNDNELDVDFLGHWGKHLVKTYGLSVESAMDLELEAAELYAHDTRDGWCCACDADIAFAAQEVRHEPEFQALLIKQRLEELDYIDPVAQASPDVRYVVSQRQATLKAQLQAIEGLSK